MTHGVMKKTLPRRAPLPLRECYNRFPSPPNKESISCRLLPTTKPSWSPRKLTRLLVKWSTTRSTMLINSVGARTILPRLFGKCSVPQGRPSLPWSIGFRREWRGSLRSKKPSARRRGRSMDRSSSNWGLRSGRKFTCFSRNGSPRNFTRKAKILKQVSYFSSKYLTSPVQKDSRRWSGLFSWHGLS